MKQFYVTHATKKITFSYHESHVNVVWSATNHPTWFCNIKFNWIIYHLKDKIIHPFTYQDFILMVSFLGIILIWIHVNNLHFIRRYPTKCISNFNHSLFTELRLECVSKCSSDAFTKFLQYFQRTVARFLVSCTVHNFCTY